VTVTLNVTEAVIVRRRGALPGAREAAEAAVSG
jgi:hypothetical protein